VAWWCDAARQPLPLEIKEWTTASQGPATTYYFALGAGIRIESESLREKDLSFLIFFGWKGAFFCSGLLGSISKLYMSAKAAWLIYLNKKYMQQGRKASLTLGQRQT
jgi:hypothetical protein